jgi:hypothetical protein
LFGTTEYTTALADPVAVDSTTNMSFLFPHIRVELLIRTILTRQWDDETWPVVREEFKKAMALRSKLRRAGWWN